jgi:hypothetical protein
MLLIAMRAQQEKFRWRLRNPENDPLENDLVETILLFQPCLWEWPSMATSRAEQ